MGFESNWSAVRTRFESRWDDAAANRCDSDLALRAASSRFLAGDRSLVMYGGGNTSIKGTWTDGTRCVWVKGTGADLAAVSPRHFVPIDCDRAVALLDGPPLDNAGLAATLEPLKLAPAEGGPSIETLMHAFLPARFVEHTHADSVLAVLNTEAGTALADSVFGDLAPLVPFRHSGFELAQVCRDTFRARATAETTGLLLAFHGAVAYADDARTSYERMGAIVARAETWLADRGAWDLPRADIAERDAAGAMRLAELRLALSRTSGMPMVLMVDSSPEAAAYARRSDLETVALQGPATPQHAVFTKQLPALGLDVESYAAAYRTYLAAHGAPYAPAKLPDPAPRVLIDPRFGVISTSIDHWRAGMVAEVVTHGIAIASRAAAHDRYVSLPPADILAAEVHYGGHEHRWYAASRSKHAYVGCVVLVVGTLEPGVRQRLEAGSGHVIEVDAVSERILVDAAYDCGGVDVLISPAAASSPLLDYLLTHSPGGGLVCTETDAEALLDRICHHWQRAFPNP